MSANRQRIANIELDERTVVRRGADIEHERAVAIFDLLEENTFAPNLDGEGPYDLLLSVREDRLIFAISAGGSHLGEVALALLPFRRLVKDYFTVCESYFEAIKVAPPSQIEAIDMGRRGLHDEGSELLRDQLASRIEIDFNTARRLFTLLCVLHIRG
ncbi:MAG: UPF0262 family protein [Alphaproteobacteria bacterium]|nr:UPF0262 family protein [Alphaproteobacteria bacterium]